MSLPLNVLMNRDAKNATSRTKYIYIAAYLFESNCTNDSDCSFGIYSEFGIIVNNQKYVISVQEKNNIEYSFL